MAWRNILLTAAVVTLVVLGSTPAHAASPAGGCTIAQQFAGQCPPVQSSVDGDRLDLSATGHGDGASPQYSRRGVNNSPPSQSESRSEPLQDGDLLPGCPDMPFEPSNCFYEAPDAAPPEDTPGPAPTVTLDDLASFSPRADRLSAEPGDWAIAGLAVNPVADDAPAAASGELLGLPAEVRFTPVEFLWDHGDGSTLSTPDGGATWADLGQAEFSQTATSHVYEQPGTYTLSLAVRFAAEYSVGGGTWTPVAGTLLADSGAFDITVGSAGTVLVDRDCRTGARGPGC